MTVIDIAIEYLTKMLIRQDMKDKANEKVEYITISKVDFIKHGIKMLKLLKKN